MRTKLKTLLVVAALLAGVARTAPVAAQSAPSSCTQAGYGQADATYPVGAQGGQYASNNLGDGDTGHTDPYAQQVKDAKSYGVQSRLTVRAIVVRGCDGKTIALMKDDHYLSQDAVQRRIGQILAASGSSVTYANILASATHDHNSPYQVTPSWGVWLFQDTFDARMFEFFARRAAAAIMAAEANLQPARMGATEIQNDIYKANIPGPGVADDGTPAGYPRNFGDHGVQMLRFDNADTGKPIATWINWGMHGESLDGYDLESADYIGPLERFVQRGTGAPMVFSQGDVGSSEGPYDGWDAPPKWLPDGTRRAWAHMGYAQAERGARYLADSVIQGFNDIGSGGGKVPYQTSFPVASYNGWIPLPKSHPYPSVGNCRTEPTAEGNPGAPGAGLPDCQRSPVAPDPNNIIWQNLKDEGVPVPENYDLPSYGAVEENMRLRLQAFRLGDVLLGSCSCEPQVDLIKNFESRADDVVGNLWDGYEWKCTSPAYGTGDPTAVHEWQCDNPDHPGTTNTFHFSDDAYRRMLAEIHNNAAGWDDTSNVATTGSEPADPSLIKGNFTKEELGGTGTPQAAENVLPTTGYKMVVGIGHSGDYDGYTVSYREYQDDDAYRKALTCCGPHSADYMVTNLVDMGQALKGGPDLVAQNPYNQGAAADEARQVAFTTALGQATSAAYDRYEAALPDDANAGHIVQQPKNIQRFDAANFTWTGGSNAVDNPVVVVQRQTSDGWTDYADQSGEVQTFVQFPEVLTGNVNTYTGNQEWQWTANFEAFDFGPRTDIDPRGPQTPDGNYRFVVHGTSRQGGADHPYDLTSDPFTVSKWTGINVGDIRAESNGLSFTVAGAHNATETDIAPGLPQPQIRYPRTYTPAPVIRFIQDDGRKDICKTCSFRPWAVGSNVATAAVTIERADGTVEHVPAALQNGRWYANVALYQGDRAYVAAGGIRDNFGETNGQPSATIVGTAPRPPQQSHLTYGGPSGGQYSDQVSLRATLTSASGAPIAGAPVSFVLSDASGQTTWPTTTDSSGVATRSVTLTQRPGSYSLTASFAGSSTFAASSVQAPFTVAKEDSSLALTAAGQGAQRHLDATLTDADTASNVISGATVTFYSDGVRMGQAVTDSHGVATFTPPPNQRGGHHTYSASFGGNDYYLNSTASSGGGATPA